MRNVRLIAVLIGSVVASVLLLALACENEDKQLAVRFDLRAENLDFTTTDLIVPAGRDVEIEFTNLDEVPHNFTLWESSDTQEQIFGGEDVTAFNETVTYQFTAPSEPGTYYFNCTIHPEQMNGDFVVQRRD